MAPTSNDVAWQSDLQSVHLFSIEERLLLGQVEAELVKLDSYAKQPLSNWFVSIVKRFDEAGSRELRIDDGNQVVDMSLSVDFSTIDPFGVAFPEVRLQFRKRSPSKLLRKARRILGRVPPATVLVLTPKGYRRTPLRNLEAKRFLQSRRPRLAPYAPSSTVVLTRYLGDTFARVLLRSARL
jgi:hypothetical protein